MNHKRRATDMQKYTRKYKLLAIFGYGTIALGFALMAYIAFLLFCPTQTLEVKNAPMPIVNGSEFKAGDKITYRYDYCKYYDDPVSITKQFVDGIIYTTDPIYVATLERGCHQKDITIPIPETLPTGDYKIRIITVININQLRNDTVVYETMPFSVVNNK